MKDEEKSSPQEGRGKHWNELMREMGSGLDRTSWADSGKLFLMVVSLRGEENNRGPPPPPPPRPVRVPAVRVGQATIVMMF